MSLKALKNSNISGVVSDEPDQFLKTRSEEILNFKYSSPFLKSYSDHIDYPLFSNTLLLLPVFHLGRPFFLWGIDLPGTVSPLWRHQPKLG